MANRETLHLPKKGGKPDPLEVIVMDDTPEQAEYNSTLHVPTHHQHVDYSHLPPPGERGSQPVQAPKKVWGNPRLLQSAVSPGPQPLYTAPRGK